MCKSTSFWGSLFSMLYHRRMWWMQVCIAEGCAARERAGAPCKHVDACMFMRVYTEKFVFCPATQVVLGTKEQRKKKEQNSQKIKPYQDDFRFGVVVLMRLLCRDEAASSAPILLSPK
jgi:hypothetical protein